ncbi:hypothetical protein KSP40_PGU003912 [Platanthera guangdongensis]|uniref:UBA domain-containing protein n=1 Tax=Platanthera guangdongensis TaxID=2320717 RepID=A0ABR2LVU5_9ASPA
MNGGPSGFQNAPVTRSFVISCALLTAVFASRRRSATLGFSYQDIIERPRFSRVIASTLAFSSIPELMFGLYLLYYFRLFERQIGSNKYSVFVLFSISVSLLFEVLALVFLRDQASGALASGPYGLIFASFVPFLCDIPISSQFRVFGISFSDKSFIYMSGLQLFLSSWKRSFLPTICGLFAGFLYRLNVLGIRKFKIPQFVASLIGRLSLSAPRGASPSVNVRRNLPTSDRHHQERNLGSTSTSIPEPPDSSVAMLVSMGFDSNSARQALVHARNDINAATNILLEAQSQ